MARSQNFASVKAHPSGCIFLPTLWCELGVEKFALRVSSANASGFCKLLRRRRRGRD